MAEGFDGMGLGWQTLAGFARGVGRGSQSIKGKSMGERCGGSKQCLGAGKMSLGGAVGLTVTVGEEVDVPD
jgi:hypothetical protein